MASLKTNREDIVRKENGLEASALEIVPKHDFALIVSVLRPDWDGTDEDIKDRLEELYQRRKKGL